MSDIGLSLPVLITRLTGSNPSSFLSFDFSFLLPNTHPKSINRLSPGFVEMIDCVMGCCRAEKKSSLTVSVGSSVQEPRDSSAGKETVMAASGTVTSYQSLVGGSTVTVTSYQPAVNGSPAKQLSPADVSGTNEEWETASEGSDGSLHHPRRHKDSLKSASSDPLSSVPVGCSIRVSPCTSGVPSLAAVTDLDHSWKDASASLYHLDVGSSTTQQYDLTVIGSSSAANTNTDSAIVTVNQSAAPSSRLFPAAFGDPATKQPMIHDSLTARCGHLCTL